MAQLTSASLTLLVAADEYDVILSVTNKKGALRAPLSDWKTNFIRDFRDHTHIRRRSGRNNHSSRSHSSCQLLGLVHE